jgi:hypothetical protein
MDTAVGPVGRNNKLQSPMQIGLPLPTCYYAVDEIAVRHPANLPESTARNLQADVDLRMSYSILHEWYTVSYCS